MGRLEQLHFTLRPFFSPSQTSHPLQKTSVVFLMTTMKFPLLLCVLLTSLTDIKAAATDDLCGLCCNTTPKPTDPTTPSTDPTTKPTDPTTKPTEPTTKPTEPTTKP